MAPGSDILKRNRSKSSNWWVVKRHEDNQLQVREDESRIISCNQVLRKKRPASSTIKKKNDTTSTKIKIPIIHQDLSENRKKKIKTNPKLEHDSLVSVNSRSCTGENSSKKRYPEDYHVEIEVASSNLVGHRHRRKNKVARLTGSDNTQSSGSAIAKAIKSRKKSTAFSSIEYQKRPYVGHLENQDPEYTEYSSETDDSYPYQKLKAVTKSVSRRTIDSKWSSLPSGCVDLISLLFQDIQLPVIVSLNTRLKTQASTALQMISHRLINKISKGILFPPGNKRNRERDFDFKRISSYKRSLEEQLTPALHANQLLKSALAKELEFLKLEQEKLTELETNSKKELSLRSERLKKLHPVLRADCKNEVYNFEEDIGLNTEVKDFSSPTNLNVKYDKELANLYEQVQDHAGNLQNHVKQVDGIGESIARSKASIQAKLFDHLERKKYEDIITGTEY